MTILRHKNLLAGRASGAVAYFGRQVRGLVGSLATLGALQRVNDAHVGQIRLAPQAIGDFQKSPRFLRFHLERGALHVVKIMQAVTPDGMNSPMVSLCDDSDAGRANAQHFSSLLAGAMVTKGGRLSTCALATDGSCVTAGFLPTLFSQVNPSAAAYAPALGRIAHVKSPYSNRAGLPAPDDQL